MAIQGYERTGWMQMFEQTRSPNGALQRFFTVKPGNVFNGTKVQIDIVRSDEDVAVVIAPGETGSRSNEAAKYSTKEFEPPTYSEDAPFNVDDLLTREAGVNTFEAALDAYGPMMLARMVRTARLLDDKIKRAVEIQAAQVLTTGQLDLQDSGGNTLYSLDFSPKASHFPTVGTAWSNPAADALGDLESLANQIRIDGKIESRKLFMGDVAFREFRNNTEVKALLDNRRMDIGGLSPRFDGSGATYQGNIAVGAYPFELWTYADRYKDPQTGISTKYLPDDKVIMLSDDTRLDRVSAMIPMPLPPEPALAGMLPGRMSSADFDVTPNIYAATNRKGITFELSTKTLLIPVAIDAYGCLTT